MGLRVSGFRALGFRVFEGFFENACQGLQGLRFRVGGLGFRFHQCLHK